MNAFHQEHKESTNSGTEARLFRSVVLVLPLIPLIIKEVTQWRKYPLRKRIISCFRSPCYWTKVSVKSLSQTGCLSRHRHFDQLRTIRRDWGGVTLSQREQKCEKFNYICMSCGSFCWGSTTQYIDSLN